MDRSGIASHERAGVRRAGRADAVKLRYKAPDGDEPLITVPVKNRTADLSATSVSPPPSEFGMVLRQSGIVDRRRSGCPALARRFRKRILTAIARVLRLVELAGALPAHSTADTDRR